MARSRRVFLKASVTVGAASTLGLEPIVPPGAQGATLVPHPDWPNCLQCHLPQDPSVKPLVRNTFGDPGPGRPK